MVPSQARLKPGWLCHWWRSGCLDGGLPSTARPQRLRADGVVGLAVFLVEQPNPDSRATLQPGDLVDGRRASPSSFGLPICGDCVVQKVPAATMHAPIGETAGVRPP